MRWEIHGKILLALLTTAGHITSHVGLSGSSNHTHKAECAIFACICSTSGCENVSYVCFIVYAKNLR